MLKREGGLVWQAHPRTNGLIVQGTTLRAVISIGLFWGLAGAFGFWGAIAAAALGELCAAAIYGWRFRSLRAVRPAASIPSASSCWSARRFALPR